MATTVLGAVNTGDITLGVDQSLEEAVSGTTSALVATVDMIGSKTTGSVLVANIAQNGMGINGLVANSLTGVNATLGGISTTALGAVNTGTIVSGVNSGVSGVVSDLVGSAAE